MLYIKMYLNLYMYRKNRRRLSQNHVAGFPPKGDTQPTTAHSRRLRVFAGRKREIRLLLDSFNRSKGSLCVLRGRRRIGKTRLIKELAYKEKKGKKGKGVVLRYLTSAPPEPKVTDDQERRLYAEQVKAEFSLSYMPPHDTWRELFSFLADTCSEKKTILAIDEVNWLATRSPDFIAVLFELWERQFSQKPEFILLLSGSLASWMKENILMNKGFVGRVSVSITLRELELNDMLAFFGSRLLKTPGIDVIKMLSALGGVPRYLEELNLEQTAEANLERIAFDETGMLHDEFEKMFYDLFSRENKFYRRILETVGESGTLLTAKELAHKMELTYSGRYTNAINVLSEVGFLRHQHSWNLSTRKAGTKNVIRLSDNYTAFYFRAILKNKRRSGSTGGKPKNLASLMGLQFENLAFNNRQFIFEQLNINPEDVLFAGPYSQTSTAKRKGCQIDLLIQVRNRVYICECKLSTSEIPSSVVLEVVDKISKLSNPKGVSFHPVLIHANTVADTIYEEDYFDAIIDMTDGLGR